MAHLTLGIARGLSEDVLIPAFEAALNGGIKQLEITLNTPQALELIQKARQHFGNRALIGAGTVCNPQELDQALTAGAQFIVSPLTNPAMIRHCVNEGIPVYPGALTPTEVYLAHEAGATMVKVFPIHQVGGPAYVKELRGPFPQIKILACGGVTPQNVPDYLAQGVAGIAVGSQLFRQEWLKAQDFAKITWAATQLTGSHTNHTNHVGT